MSVLDPSAPTPNRAASERADRHAAVAIVAAWAALALLAVWRQLAG